MELERQILFQISVVHQNWFLLFCAWLMCNLFYAKDLQIFSLSFVYDFFFPKVKKAAAQNPDKQTTALVRSLPPPQRSMHPGIGYRKYLWRKFSQRFLFRLQIEGRILSEIISFPWSRPDVKTRVISTIHSSFWSLTHEIAQEARVSVL